MENNDQSLEDDLWSNLGDPTKPDMGECPRHGGKRRPKLDEYYLDYFRQKQAQVCHIHNIFIHCYDLLNLLEIRYTDMDDFGDSDGEDGVQSIEEDQAGCIFGVQLAYVSLQSYNFWER